MTRGVGTHGFNPGINGSAYFSPDGSKLLTGHGTATGLWDVATGVPHVWYVHDVPIIDVAFHPSGAKVLAVSGRLRSSRGRDSDGFRLFQWPVPDAMQGDLDRIETWIQLVSGGKLEGEDLNRITDQERDLLSERLKRLGGPVVAAVVGQP